MKPPVIYIAGPYSDPDEARIGVNVSRAMQLAGMAIRLQLGIPFVIHPLVQSRAFGLDDADPWQRDQGLYLACDIAGRCDLMWAILRDDGTLSSGAQLEVTTARDNGIGPVMRTWAEWLDWYAGMVELKSHRWDPVVPLHVREKLHVA